jgi:histidyl-tRNA synthetase
LAQIVDDAVFGLGLPFRFHVFLLIGKVLSDKLLYTRNSYQSIVIEKRLEVGYNDRAMSDKDKVKPDLGGGFRDYLPEDQIVRQNMLDTIKRVFERFGFAPLETPGLERVEVLTGGDPEFNKQIFRARLADEEENLALRFDLTVPLARVVAANSDKLVFPFKRYQTGKVWRGESPQKGRYREFTQCDIDIIGSPSVMADAEVVAVAYETLAALGLEEFVIKVNNRKLLADFSPEVLRSIDKLGKIGWEGIEKELPAGQVEKVKDFIKTTKTNDELDDLLQNLKALGVPEEKIVVDNTIVRGLGYYTGTVFEVVFTSPDLESYGSIFSGGRYDNLVERFSPMKIPAIGASLGFDRLFAALDELGMLPRQKTAAKVLVLNFDDSCQVAVQKVTTELRRSDIPTELYLGQENTFKGQLAYAVKKEYPVVIIIGPDEKARGAVTVKNMSARVQTEAALDEVISKVREILAL